jgi:hypothetical protein
MTIHHVAVTVMGDRIYVCFSFVEGSVMSNLQAHVMLRTFQRSSSSLVTNLDRETERRKDFKFPADFLMRLRFWDWSSTIHIVTRSRCVKL